MSRRTEAGLLKVRPLRPGSRVAIVAPASPVARDEFDRGVAELLRLGFEPVFDDRVFSRKGFVAGPVGLRTEALRKALTSTDVDAVIAVRGGYGSVELLPGLVPDALALAGAGFVGYSDCTSLHVFLNSVLGRVSVHGPMLEGRLAAGPAAYDPDSFRGSLSATPLGELAPSGVEVVRPGEVAGPLFGGTLTQLLGSLGTPWEFRPPAGHVLFLDEVGERPYRLQRMLTQLRQSGRLGAASAVVFGQLPRCDEPGGGATGRGVVADVLAEFPGPVLVGFPSGHTTTPLVSLPFGVRTRVVASASPKLVVEEAAACE
jgi:muramoyltetrapeptide carboxypeptidase